MILKKKRLNLISIVLTMIIFLINGTNVFASQEAAENDVYVRQMGKGYCTLAAAVDMMRSKMYIEGNSSWP